jgi:RNA polymerase sigma-70 factor (ECF subfamily)
VRAPGDIYLLTVDDLYDQFGEALHRYAVGLAQDEDRADDLVQETLIRAMTHLLLLERLNPHQRQAWLYKTLRNRFLDGERARRRRENLLLQLSWEAEGATYMARALDLSEVLEQIPERYREVLERQQLLGMTSEEIGRELDVPAATVRSRLRLARKWLRAHRSELIR